MSDFSKYFLGDPRDDYDFIINDKLMIGTVEFAENLSRLSEIGVTHILSLGETPSHKSEKIVYKFCSVADEESARIIDLFPECIDFIKLGIKVGKVLVNYRKGKSRSVTIVAAYLISLGYFDVYGALGQIKSKRPIIQPNAGFFDQLVEFHSKLRPPLIIEDKLPPKIHKRCFRCGFGTESVFREGHLYHQCLSEKCHASIHTQDKDCQECVREQERERLMKRRINFVLFASPP